MGQECSPERVAVEMHGALPGCARWHCQRVPGRQHHVIGPDARPRPPPRDHLTAGPPARLPQILRVKDADGQGVALVLGVHVDASPAALEGCEDGAGATDLRVHPNCGQLGVTLSGPQKKTRTHRLGVFKVGQRPLVELPIAIGRVLEGRWERHRLDAGLGAVERELAGRTDLDRVRPACV